MIYNLDSIVSNAVINPKQIAIYVNIYHYSYIQLNMEKFVLDTQTSELIPLIRDKRGTPIS